MHSPLRVLLADDEPLFLSTTAKLLSKLGYECTCVTNAGDALRALREHRFDVALVDLNMPGNLQLELLRDGRAQFPRVPMIVVTGMPTLPSAIESVRLGIADYLLKPVEFDDLATTIRRVTRTMPEAPVTRATTAWERPEIIGRSDALKRVIDIIDRVAATDVNVMLCGESGTGKEVFARLIHSQSRRAGQAFQVVDCAAIPNELLESTLFGHSKGAFTGAVTDQPGLLVRSNQGTAFFDEMGELPLPLQAKLLRVLQFQRFTPVGKDHEVAIDARIISATNRDLNAEIRQGRFRLDLFYRLAVVQITLPPLRARGDDVVLLAERFLQEAAERGGSAEAIAPEVLDLFRSYAWPGNIRQLRNCLFHASSMCRDKTIRLDDLPDDLRGPGPEVAKLAAPSGRSRSDYVATAERDYLAQILVRNAGNVSKAAREAGMSRQGLHKLLAKHDISSRDYRK